MMSSKYWRMRTMSDEKNIDTDVMDKKEEFEDICFFMQTT